MTKAKKEIKEIVEGIAYEAGDSLGMGYEKYIKKIENLLKQQRKEIIRDMKNWTKGRKITKDRVREYLNKIK